MKPVNVLDQVISWFAPATALRRRAARSVLAEWEAAKPSKFNRRKVDRSAPDTQVGRAAETLRGLARHGQQNHDLITGAIRILSDNVIGAKGIGIEPQPRNFDSTVNTEYASALLAGWRDWCKNPEVTKRFSFTRMCRMTFESYIRDGEIFAQRIMGPVQTYNHGTMVPYSLEMIEADLIPLQYQDTEKNIFQGIERNAWGEAVGFWAHKGFPYGTPYARTTSDLKRIDANRMFHLARLDRFTQLRGVSLFASVLDRLDDLKDYEASERIAARIAAALTAYVKKGSPDLYGESSRGDPAQGPNKPRNLSLQPGMIIDSLRPGEEIGMISSDRPNPGLMAFRAGQLRAVAAGLGASYSSLARDYSGTYSSQRQELMEAYLRYAVMADDFICDFVQPVWQDYVSVSHLSGTIPRPKTVDPKMADDAAFVSQSMPWIDPMREAMAIHQMVLDGFMSEVEAIRRRGGSPEEVLDQIRQFREKSKTAGLIFASDAANQHAFQGNTIIDKGAE